MSAAVGVARHNQWDRRVGRIHKPTRAIDPHTYRTEYRAVCGQRVEHARPASLTGWPEDVCHRCYPKEGAR